MASRLPPMHVLLARPRGYCAGVARAVDALDHAVQVYGAPLYCYHDIVHNETVVERFRKRGVTFVSHLDSVPAQALLFLSAHGVAPSLRDQARQKNIRLVDATCPLVDKVHREAKRFVADGHHVLVLGHRGHDEVQGILGEAPHAITVLEVDEPWHRIQGQLDQLPERVTRNLAYVTQTTLSVSDTAQIIVSLKQRFPTIVGPTVSDICYATQNRQQALLALLPRVSAVLVLGSKSSSNTQRLVEIAKGKAKEVFALDTPRDLALTQLKKHQSIALTAGASVPEDLVEQTLTLLSKHFTLRCEDVSMVTESVRFGRPQGLTGTQLAT